MGKLIIIDGNSIGKMMYYGLPQITKKEEKELPNAVQGGMKLLENFRIQEDNEYMIGLFSKENHKKISQLLELWKQQLQKQSIATLWSENGNFAGINSVINMVSKEQEVLLVTTDKKMCSLVGGKVQVCVILSGQQMEYYDKDRMEKEFHMSGASYGLALHMADCLRKEQEKYPVYEKTILKLVSELQVETAEDFYEKLESCISKSLKERLQKKKDVILEGERKLLSEKNSTPATISLEEMRINRDMFWQSADLEDENPFLLDESTGETKKEQETKLWNVIRVEDFAKAEEIFAECTKQIDSFSFQFLISTKKNSANDEVKEIKGVAFSHNGSDVYYIETMLFFTEDYLVDKIGQCIQNAKQIVTFDLKEQLFLFADTKVYEACADRAKDIVVACYLLEPLKSEYTSQYMAKEYLGMEIPSMEEMFGKVKVEKAIEAGHKNLSNYAANMAGCSFLCFSKVYDRLKKEGMEQLFDEIEMPLVFTLFEMEQTGVKVQAGELDKLSVKLTTEIERIQDEIYKEAGEEFNINSPKQLGEVLFEHMKLPNGKKTKTGYSTSAEVLEKLSAEYPFVKKILEYRQYTKLNSTYAVGLKGCISSDGRIHSKFNQTITATGRISSTEPNLQNIPIRMELGRQIRKVFVPREGFVLIDADYSQIELRVLAHMSKDENLIQAYRSREDIHKMTASQVFHIPFDEVTPQQRRNAKAVNFGIVYGISSFGLSEDLSISRKEANEYIQKYFETYPAIKTFLDGLVDEAKEKGYVKTLFHRKRPIPELQSSAYMQRAFGERVAMNSPIQGTAADIIKIAMVAVNRKLKEKNLESKLILQVHDELIIEAKLEEVEQVKEILASQMQQAASLAVPLDIDLQCADSWYDAH